MAENQVVNVPRLIAKDMESNCALLEWLDSSTVENIGPNDIQQTCRFIEALHELRYAKNADKIAPGVDQCLSGSSDCRRRASLECNCCTISDPDRH